MENFRSSSKIGISLLFLTFILSFSVLAQSAKNQTPAENKELIEARRAIDAGNAKWIEGWRKGDAAMVASIFAEDGTQLLSKGRINKGRDAILKSQQRAMQSLEPGVEVTVETAEVWLLNGDAYETGKWGYKYIAKGEKTTTVETGRYVTIWKKQKDGAWKLYLDMDVPLGDK